MDKQLNNYDEIQDYEDLRLAIKNENDETDDWIKNEDPELGEILENEKEMSEKISINLDILGKNYDSLIALYPKFVKKVLDAGGDDTAVDDFVSWIDNQLNKEFGDEL